jgi:hypothetical protein
MSARPERPIADSYWVRPGRLLADEYPGAPTESKAHRKVRRMVQAGFDFFLDLTEPGELVPYRKLLHEEAAAQGHTAIHRRMPIPDGGVPTREEMVRILDTLDAALEAGHRVYFHCWGGIGRTGTVAGCYLVRHGMAGDAALAEIARRRQGTPDGHRPAPETAAQWEMVQSWQE